MTVWIAPVHNHERDSGFHTCINDVAQRSAIGVKSDPNVLNITDDPIQALQPIRRWTLGFTVQTLDRYTCLGIAAVFHMLSSISIASEAVFRCPDLLHIHTQRNQMIHRMGAVR